MERVELPLSKLTLAQKLDLMEAIWDDLAKHEDSLESPHWHEEVLKERERALAGGKAIVSDWEEAKGRIRRKVTRPVTLSGQPGDDAKHYQLRAVKLAIEESTK